MRTLRLTSALKDPIPFEAIKVQLQEPIKGIVISEDIKLRRSEQAEMLEQIVEKIKCTNPDFALLDNILIQVLDDRFHNEELYHYLETKRLNEKAVTSGGRAIKLQQSEIDMEYSKWLYGKCENKFFDNEEAPFKYKGVEVKSKDKDSGETSEIKISRSFTKSEVDELYRKRDNNEITQEEFDEAGSSGIEIEIEEAEKKQLVFLSSSIITLDLRAIGYDKRELGKCLAHELGHVLYGYKHPVKAKAWERISKLNGHEAKNPSGEEADAQYTLFSKNYSRCFE